MAVIQDISIKRTLSIGAALAFALLAIPAAVVSAAEFAVGSVQTVDAPRIYRLDGVVEAVNRGTMTAQTAGQVAEVRVDVDDLVDKNTVIIVLKDTEQQAGLGRAEANLSGTIARREEATEDHRRVRDLYERELVSKSELDRATAALRSATSAAQAAQADLERAEEELERTRIKAPYSGIVTERHIEVGETAQPGQPLISGISLDKLRVTVDVPQNLVAPIREIGQAFIEQPGAGWLPASNLTIFPYADSGSNTFKVRLALDQVRGLYPGMFIKVGFVVGSQQALVVPSEAVVFRSEVVGVYVVDDAGGVQFRHVRVGHEINPGRLVVLSGLDDGERVALDPIAAAVTLKAQRSGE